MASAPQFRPDRVQVPDLKGERYASSAARLDGSPPGIGDAQAGLVRQPELHKPVRFMEHREVEHVTVENDRRRPLPAVQYRIGAA